MQDITQNSKRGWIHWCPQPLTRFSDFWSYLFDCSLAPYYWYQLSLSLSPSGSLHWFFCRSSHDIERRAFIQSLGQAYILPCLAPIELAQEGRRPTSCWRLLVLIILLNQWSHIKEYIHHHHIFFNWIQKMRSRWWCDGEGDDAWHDRCRWWFC